MSTMAADPARYLLGIDVGNTVIKVVLFDLDGRQVAAYAIDGQSTAPEPGHVERDLEELWRNASVALRRCISDAGIEPTEIVAAGCAGHGNGLYLLDRDDRPLIGIQSLDTRAAALAEELAASTARRFTQPPSRSRGRRRRRCSWLDAAQPSGMLDRPARSSCARTTSPSN